MTSFTSEDGSETFHIRMSRCRRIEGHVVEEIRNGVEPRLEIGNGEVVMVIVGQTMDDDIAEGEGGAIIEAASEAVDSSTKHLVEFVFQKHRRVHDEVPFRSVYFVQESDGVTFLIELERLDIAENGWRARRPSLRGENGTNLPELRDRRQLKELVLRGKDVLTQSLLRVAKRLIIRMDQDLTLTNATLLFVIETVLLALFHVRDHDGEYDGRPIYTCGRG